MAQDQPMALDNRRYGELRYNDQMQSHFTNSSYHELPISFASLRFLICFQRYCLSRRAFIKDSLIYYTILAAKTQHNVD